MAWTFYLTIANGTDRDLVLESSSLEWGLWYRNGVDDRGPCTVPAGQTIQALGIRAAKGTWTGYECHAEWRDTAPAGETSYGTVSVMVDVPFSGSNASSLTKAGALRADGWLQLESDGHDFSRSIEVTVGDGGRLVATAVEEDPLELEYAEYLQAMEELNPQISIWEEVRDRLPEMDDFNPLKNIPGEYGQKTLMFGRSAPIPIKKDLWDGIGDPSYSNRYAKQTLVSEYFHVAIHSVGTDPRALVSLPAGGERTVSRRITTTSAIKKVLTQSWSLRSSLTTNTSDPVSGSSIAAELESQTGIEDVLEESTEGVTEEIVAETFRAPQDSDLLIVPWVFCTAVAIYRKDKKGRYGLVAVSEWARVQIYKSYRVKVEDPKQV